MCISLPALVLEVDERRADALVEIGDAQRHVSLSVLVLAGETVAPGDWLLVNAGLALERIDEEEARTYHDLIGEER